MTSLKGTKITATRRERLVTWNTSKWKNSVLNKKKIQLRLLTQKVYIKPSARVLGWGRGAGIRFLFVVVVVLSTFSEEIARNISVLRH